MWRRSAGTSPAEEPVAHNFPQGSNYGSYGERSRGTNLRPRCSWCSDLWVPLIAAMNQTTAQGPYVALWVFESGPHKCFKTNVNKELKTVMPSKTLDFIATLLSVFFKWYWSNMFSRWVTKTRHLHLLLLQRPLCHILEHIVATPVTMLVHSCSAGTSLRTRRLSWRTFYIPV